MHIDSENRRLYKRGITFIFFKRHRGHYLLKDNTTDLPISISVASSAVFASDQSPEPIENNAAPPAIFPAKSATAYEWHQLIAYIHNKAIQHLLVAAEGVVVSNKNKVLPTNKCETYTLSKAYRIVSRSPAKSETSNKPFFRVIYDLIQINTAFNKDE